MKLLFVLFAICFTSLPGKSQGTQDSFVRLYNGEIATTQQRVEIIKLIEEVVAKEAQISSVYRKFSDGSHGYLGKALYEDYGIIPSSAATNRLRVLKFGFKVLDSSDRGCRIAPLNKRGDPVYDGDIFVVGLVGYTDRTYDSVRLMKHLGDYSYTTVLGSSRTIPKYELGVPSTKEAFLAAQRK